MTTLEEQTAKGIAVLAAAIQALAPSASRAEPTPGPWAVDPDGDVEDAQRANVALVMHSGRTEGVRCANARLIAAAPDLLTAARKAVDLLTLLRPEPIYTIVGDHNTYGAAVEFAIQTAGTRWYEVTCWKGPESGRRTFTSRSGLYTIDAAYGVVEAWCTSMRKNQPPMGVVAERIAPPVPEGAKGDK